MGERSPLDIEKLLQWTYRDELPKQAEGGLSRWERSIFLGGADRGDSGYEERLPVALGPPHIDAIYLDRRVRMLDDVRIQWPSAGKALLGELLPWLQDSELPLVRSMQAQTSALVQMHARMGTRPAWDLAHRFLPQRGANNRPMVIGITAGRRYAKGAHSPLRIDPPAPEIVSARFEYVVWRSALVTLANESCELRDHAAQHPAAAAAPWQRDDERKPDGAVRFAPRYRSLTMS